MTKTSEEQLAEMYGQPSEDVTTRPQPEQLRLAGKGTLIEHGNTKVALARVEYVESLEALVREQRLMIESLAARVKKVEHGIVRAANIADRRINVVESKMNNGRWN